MRKLLFKSRTIFILILFVATILRFWQLGSIPTGLTNDEASYIYNAYSIWHTHRDITGKLFPLSINLDNSFSPVPIYLNAPIVGIFGMTPFTGRLLFALAGIATVCVLYFLTKFLFKNEFIALTSMLVLAVSPWHVHFSRAAYDGVLALFFYLLAIYIFVSTLKKGKIYLSLPFFFLGFYSYHATKIFFVFLIPTLLFIWIKDLLKHKKSLFVFLLGILLIISSFLWIEKTQNVTRDKVFLNYNSKDAADTVNSERKVNSAPFFVRQIFDNKILYFFRVSRENYLEAFSTQFLFLYGETSGLSGIYGPAFRGELYILELPLLILGLFFLGNYKNKKSKYFIFLCLLIAPLPSAFTVDKSYALRSIMMIPFLAIIISCGIYFLKSYYRSKILYKIGAFIFCSFYLFLIASYLFQYYSRYSIYGAESWFRSSRDVVEYAYQHRDNYKNVYIVNSGDLLIQYAVFGHTSPVLMQRAYESKSPKKVDSNVYLVDGCIDTHKKIFDPQTYLPKSTLYIVPSSCFPEVVPLDLIRQVGEPLRTIWKIYENK